MEVTTSIRDLKSEEIPPGPIVLHWPDLLTLPNNLRRLTQPLLLVTSADPESLRVAPLLDPQVVLFTGEEDRLSEALKSLALTPMFMEVQSLISEARHLSPLIRAALRVIFLPEVDPAWSEGGRRAVKRIADLAREIRASPDYLRHVASRDGVDLRFMIDASLAVRAVWLHKLSDTSWEKVAWDLGYSSGSGLHALFHRVVGCGPKEAAEEDLHLLWNLLSEVLRAG